MATFHDGPGSGQRAQQRAIAQALFAEYGTSHKLSLDAALELAQAGKEAAPQYGLTEQQYGIAAGKGMAAHRSRRVQSQGAVRAAKAHDTFVWRSPHS